MPYTKIYIHCVWSTKNREPLITKELKPLLLQHIKENSIKKEIYIDSINCVSDHIHILLSLGKEQTISKTIMLIKGESSFWVNKQDIISGKFEWQDDYFAGSVSYREIDTARAYIENQEQHHKTVSFMDEYESFIKENNLEEVLAKASGKK